MENRSFEENSSSDNPVEDPKGHPVEDPKGHPVEDPRGHPVEDPRGHPVEDPRGHPVEDPKSNLPGPSDESLLANPSDTKRKQPRSIRSYIPSTGLPVEEKDDGSPPAYVQRYMKPKQKMDDMVSLEYPDPSQEPGLDPELQQQAKRRRERRLRQRLIAGPCSLRPDSPNQPPLPEPEPYPDPDSNPNPNQDQEPTYQQLQLPVTSLTCSESIRGMYQSLGMFAFQFPFHTLLLTWPLATAAMGVLNMRGCQLNIYLSPLMMVVGILGTIATIFRLYTLYYSNRLSNINTGSYYGIVRGTEAIVWVFFGTQLYYFFIQTPSFSPKDDHFCKWKYYKINFVLMSLSSVMMVGWIIVHSIKLAQWWMSKRHERTRTAPTRT